MSNLDYKLARELKEVGFPQNGTPNGNGYWEGRGEEIDNPVWLPSLSELIEVCGWCELIPKVLKGEVVGWIAHKTDEDKEYGFENGKTPEEAVAKLYIKLNGNEKRST